MSTFVKLKVRIMNKRLQQFLAAENISQSQFADAMGIARASVSHIIAGRNKPGFEFMSAMVRNYPALNLEWLISGKGKMYKDPSRILASLPESAPAPEPAPAEPVEETIHDLFSQETPREAPESPTDDGKSAKNEFSETSLSPLETHQPIERKRSIRKIVIFFDDNTFEEIQ
mgnify:CR=1 FL=1